MGSFVPAQETKLGRWAVDERYTCRNCGTPAEANPDRPEFLLCRKCEITTNSIDTFFIQAEGKKAASLPA